MYKHSGRRAEAIEQFAIVLRLKPELPTPRQQLQSLGVNPRYNQTARLAGNRRRPQPFAKSTSNQSLFFRGCSQLRADFPDFAQIQFAGAEQREVFHAEKLVGPRLP